MNIETFLSTLAKLAHNEENKRPNRVVDAAIGKLTRIAFSSKEVDKIKLEEILLQQDFYTAPTIIKLFTIVGQFVEEEEQNKMRGTGIPGGYDYDTAAFSLYYDVTSTKGHIMNLSDLNISKKEKDRAMKLSANPEFNVPLFPKVSTRSSPKEIDAAILLDESVAVLLEPFKINQLIAAEAGKLVYVWNWKAQQLGYDHLKEVPLWKLSGKNEVQVATYYPMYKSNRSDTQLLHAVKSFLALHPNSERAPFIYLTGTKLRETMLKYQFSNGTVQGQLGRYRQVMVQQRKAALMRSQSTYKQMTTEFRKVLQLRYPLNKTTYSLKYGPIQTLRDWEREDHSGMKNPPLTINKTADAGLLYARGSTVITRDKSEWADLDIAQMVYDMFGATRAMNAHEKARFLQQQHKTTEVLQPELANTFSDGELSEMLNTSRLCKMKPKSEVYEISELKNKTRNFSVHNAGFSNLPMIFFSQVKGKTPLWHEHPTSWNMIGWSPFYGGMTSIMSQVLDKKSQAWTTRNGSLYMKPLVYADNFWCIAKHGGTERWYSMDGIKAEAHVTANDCKQLVHHFASAYPEISSTWMRYMLMWYPVLCTNSIGVLGVNQIPCPFLGSGSPGTAYLNTVATIDYVTHLERTTTKEWTEWEDRETKEVKVGNWEATEKASARFYKCEMSVPLDEIRNSQTEVKIDLLGYSCIPGKNYGMDGHWIPILDSNRLYKAITFLKTDLVAGEEQTSVTQAINFFRYRVFYALGAWFDPGLSEVLVIRCGALKKQLADVPKHVPLKEALAGVAESLSLSEIPGAEGLLTFGSPLSIPTMYDVFQLTVGAKATDLFINWCFNSATGKPWTYMPYSVFLIEAEKREYFERPLAVVYGEELGGGLEENVLDTKIYEVINQAGKSSWSVQPVIGKPSLEEEDEEFRQLHERSSALHSGKDFPLARVEAPVLGLGKPEITVHGMFAALFPGERRTIGMALEPILSMALRKQPLFVEDPNNRKQVDELFHQISIFMSTPLVIVRNALRQKEIHAGPTVPIKHNVRHNYFQTDEFIALQTALKRSQSQVNVEL